MDGRAGGTVEVWDGRGSCHCTPNISLRLMSLRVTYQDRSVKLKAAVVVNKEVQEQKSGEVSRYA